MKKGKVLLLLHLTLMWYSFSGVLSKFAALQPFLSTQFLFFYVGIIALLGVYAITWQQIIKYLPLTTAFSNKAVTVIWGFVWGTLIFHEKVKPGQLVGMALVVIGVILFSLADKERGKE